MILTDLHEYTEPKGVELALTTRTYIRLLYVSLAVLGVVYLLQIASPLRLNEDAIYLLEVTSSAVDGQGFTTPGGRTSRYPLGYPGLLALLDVVGLGVSWAFIALNCLFVLIGIIASYLIYQRVFAFNRSVALLLCCLIMLSYVLVKHVTLPLTDVAFFGATMAAALALSVAMDARGLRRWQWLLFATLLTAFSISVRAIGVAFVPALLWAGCFGSSFNMAALKRMGKYKIAALVAIGVGLSVLVLGPWNALHLSLLRDALAAYLNETEKALTYTFVTKVFAWGEMVFNVPLSKVPSSLGWTRPLFLLAGYAGVFGVFFGMWLRRRRFGPLEVFAVTYIAIMAVWYGSGARLWLPILPFVIGWIALTFQAGFKWKGVRLVASVYVVWFLFTGTAALAYSSRISLADPSDFPVRYGNGTLFPTYDYAFNGIERPQRINDKALEILVRYEPRVQEHLKHQDLP